MGEEELPSPEEQRAPRSRSLLPGVLIGVAASAVLGLPLLYASYKEGLKVGAERECKRMVEKEAAYQDEPSPAGARTLVLDAAPLPQRGAAEPAAREETGGVPGPPLMQEEVTTWVFGADECVRAVWPMEIVPTGDGEERSRFRLRQGANRLARQGTGLVEFVFRLARRARIGLFARMRCSDGCGNAVRCGIDGRTATVIDGGKIFGRWVWRPARSIYTLGPGLHRLTVGACEDGIEFDRVVVRVGARSGQAPHNLSGLGELEPTPPPVFESMPLASPTLPAIGRLTAQAFATGSLVVGKGHANTLAVFARLNAGCAQGRKTAGRVVVRCRWGSFYTAREFELSGDKRSALMTFNLALRPRGPYLMPLRAEVFVEGERIHSQRIDLIRPLSWAFLGPFPDPGARGLELALPPDERTSELPRRPAFEGHTWKVVEDGSCYDSFGVVDLNKVFGLPNVPWGGSAKKGAACVAYAVTAIASYGSRHDTLAFAFDDAGEVWLNGSALSRARGLSPVELNRQVVGTKLRKGANWFVFKVAQRGHYWHIVMEPDNSFPYGRTDNFLPLPVNLWPPHGPAPSPADPRRPGKQPFP